MWVYNDAYDVGCSANNKRGTFLNVVTDLLCEEKIELDQLLNEVQEPNSIAQNTSTSIKNHNAPLLGFLIEGKRSSRMKIAPVVPLKRQILKKTFKNFGKDPLIICTNRNHQSASTQKTPEISSAIEDLQKFNQNLKRKARGDQNGEGHKRVTKKNKTANLQHGPPILPHDFKNRIINIGGCLNSARFVIQKELFQTDVSKGHNRFSIPYNKIVNEFLTPSEMDGLGCRTISEIRATLIQPCLEECEISVRDWTSNGMYALVSTWYEVCQKNDLIQGVIVQLWSFRRNFELCFALVRIN